MKKTEKTNCLGETIRIASDCGFCVKCEAPNDRAEDRDLCCCCVSNADIRIQFAAVPNSNENKGGFVPVISVTTPSTADPLIDPSTTAWCSISYDKDVALALAKTMADEEADRWGGDYVTSVDSAPDR